MRANNKSSHVWYSPVDLAKLQCPTLPKTAKGIHERAKKEGWPSQKVRSRGGRDGTKFVYEPPPEVQREIDAHLANAPAKVDQLVAVSRAPYDSRSDAGLRHAVSESLNPENAYKAMCRIRDTTQLLRRIQDEIGYELPDAWLSVLQELLFAEQITELGAHRMVEHLKGGAR